MAKYLDGEFLTEEIKIYTSKRRKQQLKQRAREYGLTLNSYINILFNEMGDEEFDLQTIDHPDELEPVSKPVSTASKHTPVRRAHSDNNVNTAHTVNNVSTVSNEHTVNNGAQWEQCTHSVPVIPRDDEYTSTTGEHMRTMPPSEHTVNNEHSGNNVGSVGSVGNVNSDNSERNSMPFVFRRG